MSESFQDFCKRILPVVKARAEGKDIEFLSVHNDYQQYWLSKVAGDFNCNRKYRVAEPKATPLPITPEMWAMIDQKYQWAYFQHGYVIFTTYEPERNKRNMFVVVGGIDDFCQSPLNIDTTGIIPELSLTKRPDNYVIDNDVDVGYIAVHDVDKVIASIKKTAEDGSKHGVKIAEEEFSKERMIRDIAAGISGADYIVTEHYNPITGITQTIRTKIK